MKEVAGGRQLIEGLDPFPIGSEFYKYVDNDDKLYLHISDYYVQRGEYIYKCDSYRENRFTDTVHDRRETHVV